MQLEPRFHHLSIILGAGETDDSAKRIAAAAVDIADYIIAGEVVEHIYFGNRVLKETVVLVDAVEQQFAGVVV